MAEASGGSAPAYLELPLAGGLVHKFPTLESLRVWLNEEREHWSWLSNNNVSGELRSIGPVSDVVNSYSAFFGQCQSILGQDPAQIPSQIKAQATQLSPRGPILRPSAHATFIEALRTYLRSGGRADEVVGTCAAIATNRMPGQVNPNPNYLGNPVCYRAIAYFELLKVGATKASRVTAADAITQASQSILEALVAAEARIADLERQCAALLASTGAQSDELNELLAKQSAAAVDKIEATDALYRKALQIKAPVEYWTEKATEHRRLTVTYRRWLIGVGAAVLLAFVGTYLGGWEMIVTYVTKNPTTGVAMALYVAGFVAAVTAILLWAMRLVVRLYMSQHHLTIDADERAAMLKTFLALSEQEKVTEADLALVLAAVFRPTPDGIIRDDGAPNFSAGGLLSAALDSRKS